MCTRTCHFTFNPCKTSDSNVERYLMPQLMVKIHFKITTKGLSQKNDSEGSALQYFRHFREIFLLESNSNTKLFSISFKVMKCFFNTFVNRVAKFQSITPCKQYCTLFFLENELLCTVFKLPKRIENIGLPP